MIEKILAREDLISARMAKDDFFFSLTKSARFSEDGLNLELFRVTSLIISQESSDFLAPTEFSSGKDMALVCIFQVAGLKELCRRANFEGLYLSGLRLIFTGNSQPPTLATLTGARRCKERLVVACFRGTRASAILRSIIGPADPLLARRSDPSSLNACGSCVCFPPPLDPFICLKEIQWAFHDCPLLVYSRQQVNGHIRLQPGADQSLLLKLLVKIVNKLEIIACNFDFQNILALSACLEASSVEDAKLQVENLLGISDLFQEGKTEIISGNLLDKHGITMCICGEAIQNSMESVLFDILEACPEIKLTQFCIQGSCDVWNDQLFTLKYLRDAQPVPCDKVLYRPIALLRFCADSHFPEKLRSFCQRSWRNPAFVAGDVFFSHC